MRNLRLYKNDSDFKAQEQEAGGTGSAIESIVPGIVKTLDERKMYFNPHDKEIQFHTLTINYKKRSGESLAPSTTKSIKYIPGVNQEIVATPEDIEGYAPIESKKTVSIPSVSAIDFVYSPVLDPSQPLTFKIISGGTINWINSANYKGRTISYSKNGGETWTDIASTTGAGYVISVNAGDVVMFKGDNSTYALTTSNYDRFGSVSAKFEIYGNIMSLINSNNFQTATTLVSSSTFYSLFNGCSGLVSAEKLVLPATTLTTSCYGRMFRNCTNLTIAPELPAARLTDTCYQYMFSGCTSLIAAPSILPATTLTSYCYEYMFQGCTSLTTAPELPATTLAVYCCQYMFSGCTSLTTAPATLPATRLADYCYQFMFQGCTSLTTAPKLPATTLATGCYNSMFQGCTSLTSAPELLVADLRQSCYLNMFSGCSSLNYIKCLATNISAQSCTRNWVDGVASAGTFVKHVNAGSWAIDNVNGIPSGWMCVNNNDTFVLSQETVAVPLNDGFKAIGVYSLEANWSAETNDNWITVSPTTGEGGMLASNVLISASNAESARTGSVTFTNGTNTLSLTVTQKREAQPLTFNVLSGGTILWKCTVYSSYYAKTISYSKDDGATWSKITSSFSGAKIPVNSGDKILFKGNNSYYGGDSYNYFGTQSAVFSIEGNIMSLVNSSGFATTNESAIAAFAFDGLFASCTGLTSAEELILPVTTLATRCYNNMFAGCTSLTTAPELPATTLASSCYANMFSNCTSLTTAPELPAITLATYCYQSMFRGCTSLATTPVLPAATLTQYCYSDMFRGCTSLTIAPELPATTLATYCYNSMFQGCTSLTTAPVLPATTLATYCYNSMFQGCTSLTSAPELPATTLANYCYNNMFQGCTSLTTAPVLPATTLATYCYNSMFQGCTSLNYIKCLATVIPGPEYLTNWVAGVSSTGTFVKAASMTGWSRGDSGIPTNWTVQDA